MKTISVPSRRWHDNKETELTFPDFWEIDNLNSPGFDKKAISPSEIKERIDNPLSGLPLHEIAKTKKQVVIVFDDMTRPTPAGEIAVHILDALYRAGITEKQIRFLWALGSHGTYDLINARKKLNDEIVRKFPIYNHDAFQNNVYVGKTSSGLELWLNKEYISCDLKIGIGCITPQVHAGFGGGAKILLPGVAGIETINQFHNQLHNSRTSGGLGNYKNNVLRKECDSAAQIAGLDFKVDALINRRGEITDIYAGSPYVTFEVGVEEAKTHYAAKYSSLYDIVICNTYAKASESSIAFQLGMKLIKKGTGTIVLISDIPEGQVPHYAFRSWGSGYGGGQYINKPKSIAMKRLMKELIVLTPYPDRTSLDMVCHHDDATWVESWNEVLEILKRNYREGAKVAVLQDGTMQYLVEENIKSV